MVPTFTSQPFDRVGAQLCPPTSPRLRRRPSPWPPESATSTDQRVPHTRRRVWVCVATRPQSASIEPLGLLRSFQSLVPHVRLSVLLAGPGPSGGTGPSRRCQGCFPPSPPLQRFRLPSASRARCDEHEAVSFHHRTVRKRLLALYVGQPQPVRTLGLEATIHQIGRPGRAVISDGRAPLFAPHHAFQAFVAHQPFHSAPCHRHAFTLKLAPYLPCPVHAEIRLPNTRGSGCAAQRHVGIGPSTARVRALGVCAPSRLELPRFCGQFSVRGSAG